MIYITRREHFNAAHKLHNPNWTDEQNAEIFGKCANPNWHGHNYNLYVTVKGNVNPDTGYSVNLKDLSTIIRTHITDKLDHKNLNLDVPFMKGVMPSTENVAIAIWKELVPHVNAMDCKLHSIKLFETENNFVEYFGEE
ncbi:MAG: 6-carboxytetrahydropterin synthase [Bacteroidetes bacterium]|nr:6-carboxytetrahydropterin synthase [Bacteroidota bacterium]